MGLSTGGIKMAAVTHDAPPAKENILNLLNDAGSDGLHLDDILYLLGFNSKKELIPLLSDLKRKKQVQELPGERYKRSLDKSKEMNGNGTSHTTTYVAPAAKEDLPTIHLPGDPKFSSYKNTLQEFCQKKKYPVPQYQSIPEENALVGTVTFQMNFVRCEELSKSVKEADARAAYEALTHLGYKLQTGFEVPNQLKRKDVGTDNTNNTAKQAKQGQKDPITFKSQLNEYAQKKQLPFATYDTVSVNGGFFSTVHFNEEKYKAMATFKKRKDAEQNAAQVALNQLIGIPLPSSGAKDADVEKMVSEGVPAAKTVALKNRLQEYCQRMSKELPTYDTKMNETDKNYYSTVTVEGVQYTGSATKAKKQAETSAAESALKALGLMA